MPGWQEQANRILKRIGIPQFGPPSKLNKLNSTHKTIYRKHYDDQTAELIRQTYLCDVLRFGYSFEPAKANAWLGGQQT